MTYEYHNNLLSIPANLLYKEMDLISKSQYFKWCQRGKLVRTKEGKGKGNEAWVSYYDIAETWVQNAVKAYLGDPAEKVIENQLERYIITDKEAIRFFQNHRKPNGDKLSPQQQRIRVNSCSILNAIDRILKDNAAKSKMFGRKKTLIWHNISEAVNHIDTKKWKFKLPANERSLQRKFDKYRKENYFAFIHASEGNTYKTSVTKEVGNFLLAQYCLPVKLSIPEVLERYNQYREANKHWKNLTTSKIYQFLHQPENERVWTLARHGKKAYSKKFKFTTEIDKSNWFPNCYWAIDGTKLDWIHVWENSSNKLGAKLKINVLFDVYSEKIIGYDLAFTESHLEHFKAIKMAVNEAQCKPYFITYDNQSGHKMDRMQDLYNSLVADDGGAHYPGKAYEHGNPAEGLFARLQKQVINKFWFSDGQSITVKRDDNKMNEDFILSKKDSIKSVDELKDAWLAAVNIWNNKPHPLFRETGETRNQVYNHAMQKQEPLSLFDIMGKMWVEQKKRPVTYKAEGLVLRLGEKRYTYIVYDADNKIDLEFRRKNVGKKFVVRYDPDFLDGFVQLYDYNDYGELYHVADAQPKRKSQPVPMLQKPGQKAQWLEDYSIVKKELQRDQQAYEDLKKATGITPEREIEYQDLLIKMKGNLTKAQRSMVEEKETLSAASRL